MKLQAVRRVARAAIKLQREPKAAAKAARLRYVSDEQPGITRERHGKAFVYRNARGKVIQDRHILNRITSLVIPPAWTDVWICPIDNGHLQATGRDARGRKQHRYHPRWREVRDETKYGKMIAFAAAIPKIRRRVAKDLKLRGIQKQRILAMLVRLLETTLIRVGNEEYVQENGSFGLTTFRNRHAEVHGDTIQFNFRGKSGKLHQVEFTGPRVARLVRQCQDLPGHALFEYVDEQGRPQPIDSGDVNEYLREISGEEFSAKDFRTWAGTILAARVLSAAEAATSPTKAKRVIARAIAEVAERLGNTPAVCRKCYIHPAVLEAYQAGHLAEAATVAVSAAIGRRSGLSKDETALVKLLKRHNK